jgi:prolyl-tRNA synthetase
MKDAYSFHVDEKDFKREYDVMAKTYSKIFDRLGLKTLMVAADNGYIGGEYCHEFQTECELGEGRFFISKDEDYIAHEDIAEFIKEDKNLDDELAEYQKIEAIRGATMEDGVKLHGLPIWQQLKDVMYVDDKNQMILAIIRGDYDVNEIKLKHLTGSYELRHATDEEIRSIGSEPGFISPVGLEKKVLIVADDSLRTVKNMYGGANKKHLDALNMNIDRDFKAKIEGDIAMAQDGFLAPNGKSQLIEKQGIEVGNIFQLGLHYTNLMSGATFTDRDGQGKPYYMGCYGIGLGRTLAAIIEKHHDDKGITWPEVVAPFQVQLISLAGTEKRAEEVYSQLSKADIEVLWDDRDESAGVKFADADLIGNPVRLVVSTRTKDQVEWKKRTDKKIELLDLKTVIKRLTAHG